METINDNIRQLLEMLDNPEAYTEQEIQDIINRDEDTRENVAVANIRQTSPLMWMLHGKSSIKKSSPSNIVLAG